MDSSLSPSIINKKVTRSPWTHPERPLSTFYQSSRGEDPLHLPEDIVTLPCDRLLSEVEISLSAESIVPGFPEKANIG